MPVSLINGKEIRQGLVEYGEFCFLGTQVGTSGATTTAIPDATRLKGLALPSTLFNNSIVRITSGAAAGERTYVDYLDPNAGILHVHAPLTVALADGDEYEIWLRGIDPDIVDRLRDDCLQKFCSQWRVVAFSQVVDGDMEEPVTVELVAIASSTNDTPIVVTTGTAHGLVTGAQVTIEGHLINTSANGKHTVTIVTTTTFTLDDSAGVGVGIDTGKVLCENGVPFWTVAGSAIRNKLYASFPNAHSRRVLVISHLTAASDWVASERIDVQPTDKWFLEVPVQAYVTATPATPAVASVLVRDLSNGADISLSGIEEHTGRGPGMISILFEIPTDCYQVELRLKSATDSSTTVWGGIAIHEREQYRFSLPERITTRKRVGTFFTTGRETVSGQANQNFKNAPFQSIERVQVGGQVEAYVNPATTEFPMFYYERGYFPRLNPGYFTTTDRLTGDLTMTDIQKEYIIAALAARVCKYYLDKYGDAWQDDWIRASADFNYWEGQHGPEPKLIIEVESELHIPQLEV